MASDKYTVVILPEAESDIDEILDYIVNKLFNVTAAQTLWYNITDAIERVSCFPYAMPILKSDKISNGKTYRRLDVANYVLIYKVVEEMKEVRVMSVFYAASNVAAKLLERI